jgi:DNA-nicking Smr family endonuclease
VPRDLSPDERRIWARVARTVKAAPGRSIPETPAPAAPPAKTSKIPGPAKGKAATTTPPLPPEPLGVRRPGGRAPDELDPRIQRRLARERDPIEAVLDLHGYGRFQAEDRLVQFLTSCRANGLRAVMVVTGKGARGGGVIRASAAEWLTGPRLRGVVAGFSSAHRRHGGEGALYVTLKRR